MELADGEKRDALSGRLRRLLAGLLVAGGGVVSTGTLVDIVWTERRPEDPEAALHTLVARLRSRLRATSAAGAGTEIELLTRSPGYLLQVAATALDATRFEELAQRARRELGSHPGRAEELYGEALALWRGQAYAEFADEEFARPESARLEELRRTKEEDRIEAALANGRHAAAAAQLEVVVAREALRERPHRQLTVALYRSGRQADALALVRRYRERLVEELGMDPCRRLDGLPLALELAAARMGAMSPADLVQRLSWRFRLLHGGRRAPERHRTLRALVDWSYGMLDPSSRTVFSVVSVFAGSFSLEQADQLVAAVVADGEPPAADGADTVLSLVDRSMITVAAAGPRTRYVLLETLRAYGRERLDAGEHAHRARRAHAEMFVGLVEEADLHLFQPGHLTAVEGLATAVDELRAAWSWAAAHDPPLAVRLVGGMAIYVEHRMPAEVARWADATVRAVEDDPDLPGLAKLLGVAAASTRFAGDLDRARRLLERALDLPADPATAGYLRYILAEVSLFQGRLSEVDRLVSEVDGLGPNVPVAAMLSLVKPLAGAYGGDLPGAIREAEAACRAIRSDADHPLSGWAGYVLGEVMIDADPVRAQGLLDEARRTARRFDDRYLAGVALVAAATAHSRHGGAAEAVPLFLEVIEHWRVLGDWLHQWTTIRNVVDLLIRTHRFQDAALLHAALTARVRTFPTFGDDAQRMAAAAQRLAAELDPDEWAALRSRGDELADAEVLGVARDALTAMART